ncbi:glucose-fructose oxidoreductase domain-containing protein 1 isoform X2 [Budorcas taxicolor]|uniref:glucose-fructose oxidoreductase domain-containing protein 1 isoform X2 n=1 Tax=Budorcas taxicolor TaxID=37181 RepID=UPI002284CC40|nr:glucose-fructose oxidoreductase domain-containing protein 1 isoform X2 [Budorcas taxicolor]
MLPGVGVFGTSLTARVIIPLLKDEGFAVKALWGRTQEEAEELAKEMSVPFYTSRIDEVLLHQDVDLVCINLPPPLTRQIAVKTLAPGTSLPRRLSRHPQSRRKIQRTCCLQWSALGPRLELTSSPVQLVRHRQERHLRPRGHTARRLPHDVGRPLLPEAHERHGQRAALPAGLRAHEAAHRGGLRGRAAGVRGAGARRQPAGQEVQLELRRSDGRRRAALGGHLHHRPADLPHRPEGRQGPRAAQDLREADRPHQGHPSDHQRRLLHLPDGAGGRGVLCRHPQLQRARRVQAGRDRGGLGWAPPGRGHGPVRPAQQRPGAGAAGAGRHAGQQLPAA